MDLVMRAPANSHHSSRLAFYTLDREKLEVCETCFVHHSSTNADAAPRRRATLP